MSKKYRYGYSKNGQQSWSQVFDDFDECYTEYCANSKSMVERGVDLSEYQWRGVFTLEQAGLLVMEKNMYADELYVREG